MFDEHTPIVIKGEELRGLWNRNSRGFSFVSADNNPLAQVPKGFGTLWMNFWYRGGVWECRPPTAELVALNGAIGTARRLFVYNLAGVDRYLVLDSTGKIFDTGSAAPGTAILDIAAMTDFNCIVINERAYITPFTNATGVGLSGESVYVYNGTGTARKAAGTAPTTALAAATGAAGTVEIGTYLLAFAFEMDSGHITRRSPVISYTAPGGAEIDFSSVDTGPSGTVARHLLASKILPTPWDGNTENIELFFIPNATINDNATTTLNNINFLNSSLTDSAGYLQTLLETIPAGSFLCEYGNKLCVGGEFANPSLVRISEDELIESFSETTGFKQIMKGNGAGLKNGRELRGVLYLFKSNRTVSLLDNNDDPNTWPMDIVDGGLGTEPHAIADLLDYRGPTSVILVHNKAGLFAFNGSFLDRPLTYFVDKIIKFDQNTEIIFNTVEKKLFVKDGQTNNTFANLFVGDCSDGLRWDLIRWSHDKYNIAGSAATRTLASCKINSTGKLILYFTDVNKLYALTPGVITNDDGAVGIAQDIIFGSLALDDTGELCHFNGIRLNCYSIASTFNLQVLAAHKNYNFAAAGVQTRNYSISFGFLHEAFNQFDMQDERIAIQLFAGGVDNFFGFDKMTVYARKVAETLPSPTPTG